MMQVSVSKLRKLDLKLGWIARSFYCKKGWFMRHVWNTMVSPHIDYCKQLWSPKEGSELEKVEKLLKSQKLDY